MVKPQKKLKAAADEVTKQIAERFVKLFSEKITEMTDELHGHLDDHMDDLEEMITDGFSSLHEHISAIERLEKLEKKIQQLESNGKRFVT